MKLREKVAVVTGSSRGIGKAIALAFAREGASVVVAARTETAKADLPGTIGETVAQIRALRAKAIAVRCDVSQEEDVERMVKETVAEFGGIDILVNNAGLTYHVPFMQIPPKHWDLIMRVNVKGPYLACRAAIPHIAARGGGSIINVSSPAADLIRMPRPDGQGLVIGGLYGASKAALDRLTRGLAAEVAEQNIAVNALKPHGATDSEGLRFARRDIDPSSVVSADRYMTRAALFLAMQDANGITGRLFDDKSLCEEIDARRI